MVESWAFNQMGSFDQIIQQQMHGSQRGLGVQDARDRAARQLNVAERGVNSTAYPGGNSVAQAAAPVQGPAVPTSLQAAIAAQVGDDGPPVPESAPRGGDAQIAMGGQVNPNQGVAMGGMVNPNQGNVEAMIAQQMGDGTAAEQAGVTFPSDGQSAQPLPHPQSTAQAPGMDGQTMMDIVLALGGVAGVSALLHRYKNGDPDAANTFKAIGVSPDDFSMFASDPANAIGRNITPADRMQSPDAGLQTVVPRTNIAPTASIEGQIPPIGALQMAPTIDADAAMQQDQYRTNALDAAEGVEANQRPGGSNIRARNLPDSRPKAKTEAKPKSKVKVKPKVK